MLGGDSVEDSSAFGGENAGVELEAVSLLVLLDPLLLLELLKSPPDDLGGGVVAGLGLAVAFLPASVEVGEQSDSGVGAEVDFSGEGGDSDVDPVFVGGGEFLTWVLKCVRVPVLTMSTQAGLSMKLFFLR